MIEAKCPKCNSLDFDIYDTDGGVGDSVMIFRCACLEEKCDCEFNFECDIVIKSVEINEN